MSHPKPKRSRSKSGSRLEAVTAAIAGADAEVQRDDRRAAQRPAAPDGLPRGRRLPPLRRRSSPSAFARRATSIEADAERRHRDVA